MYIIILLEYCAVVRQSTHTADQSHEFKSSALRLSWGIDTLDMMMHSNIFLYKASLTEVKCLSFKLKCLLHPIRAKMFPVNLIILDKTHNTIVNWAKC